MTVLIDTHHHLWDPATGDYPWMTDELAVIRRKFEVPDLLAVTGPAGVTGTILVQTYSSYQESQDFLAIAAEEPLILGVVAWVDLTSPLVSDDLERLKAGKGGEYLVGIRHQVHDEADADWLLRDDVQRGLEAVGAHGLAYDLLLRPRELPAAIKTVRAQPGLHWVLDHIAKPEIASGGWQPWADQIADLAAASPTSWVKLSGMVTEATWDGWTEADLEPYVRHVIDCYGAERCMLGSDWPVCLLAASYHTVMDTGRALVAHLSPEERSAIYSGAAVAAYGIRLP